MEVSRVARDGRTGSDSDGVLMQETFILKAAKYSAIAISVLMLAGIAALMVISWDKDEDITGIVAPALLIAIISGIAAIVTAVLQRRLQKAIDRKKESLS